MYWIRIQPPVTVTTRWYTVVYLLVYTVDLYMCLSRVVTSYLLAGMIVQALLWSRFEYRYPRGESYIDLISRLEPMAHEFLVARYVFFFPHDLKPRGLDSNPNDGLGSGNFFLPPKRLLKRFRKKEFFGNFCPDNFRWIEKNRVRS